MVSSTAPQADEFLGERHVYTKHRAGIPPLGKYFKGAWNRRQFPRELARTAQRAANTDTVLGKLWLVMNPLLLGCVYYILVDVLNPSRHAGAAYFSYLLSGLFLFYMVHGTIMGGTNSITTGSRLILNTAFPRVLLPISAAYQALIRFWPTLIVLAVIHTLAHEPVNLATLLAIPFIAFSLIFGFGLACFFATAQVYFRDTGSFLPYFLRIWMYLSPVILTSVEIKHKFGRLANLNPLFSIFTGWHDAINGGIAPSAAVWGQSIFWTVLSLVVGLLFFMSRERDFAVRL